MTDGYVIYVPVGAIVCIILGLLKCCLGDCSDDEKYRSTHIEDPPPPPASAVRADTQHLHTDGDGAWDASPTPRHNSSNNLTSSTSDPTPLPVWNSSSFSFTASPSAPTSSRVPPVPFRGVLSIDEVNPVSAPLTRDALNRKTIGELKLMLRNKNINIKGVLEKGELVDMVLALQESERTLPPANYLPAISQGGSASGSQPSPAPAQAPARFARSESLSRTNPTTLKMECGVCAEVMMASGDSNGRRTGAGPCGHLYCMDCWMRIMNQGDRKCPSCRRVIQNPTQIIQLYQ